MTTVGTTTNSISDALSDDWNKFVHFLPEIVAALVVLLIGLIVATVLASVAKRLITMLEEEHHIKSFLAKWKVHVRTSKFISMFVWWVVFLAFISAAVQVLNIDILTQTVNSLVAYAPQLFAAALVAGLTLIAARVIKSLTVEGLKATGFSGTKAIGAVVYVAVLVFGLTIAAAQLGLDLALITANITVLVGGVALAAALAFGLGSRGVAGSLVAGWSTRGLVKKGQTLNVDGVKGKVKQITHSGIVLETSNGEHIVSHARIMK